jgi:Flp pilus assembly protein TadG
MRKAVRLCLRDMRGTAILEFALVAPVFLAMLLGIVGYGGYFWRAHLLQEVANDGARAALPGLTAGERQSLAVAAVTAEFTTLASIDITRTATSYSETAGTIMVSIQYDASRDGFMNVGLIPLPSKTIKRVAAVRIAGL